MTLISHICVEGDEVAAVYKILPGIFCWTYDSKHANRNLKKWKDIFTNVNCSPRCLWRVLFFLNIFLKRIFVAYE